MVKGKPASAQTKPRQNAKTRQDPKKPATTEAKADAAETVEITAQTMMAAESLKGDIRDALLTEIKQLKKPWEQMAEYEQERVIHRCRDIAGKLVHETVRITAARGFINMPVQLGKFTVEAEKGISCSFNMARSPENLLALGERIGSIVLIVPVDVHDFMGERKPAEADVVGDLRMPKNGQPTSGPGAPSDPDAEAKLGRGPVDGKGEPIAHDPSTGEATEPSATERQAAAGQTPGDTGPHLPPDHGEATDATPPAA
jgi:hypothetical protein